MQDPRNGFKIERIFTEDQYPYDAGGSYWKGLWVSSDGFRLYSADDYFAARIPRGYLPTPEGAGGFILPFIGVRNEIVWAGGDHTTDAFLYWSDDLDTWNAVDFDLSDLASELAVPYTNLSISRPFYHQQSGRYFVLIGVYRDGLNYLHWITGRIASATSLGDTWTLGPEVFAAPAEAFGVTEFVVGSSGAWPICHLTDSGEIVVIQGTAWNLAYYEEGVGYTFPETYYYEDAARIASSPTASFTTTTLAEFTQDTTGVIPGYTTVSDTTGGFLPVPFFAQGNLRQKGALWTIGGTEYQQVDAWASSLIGPWYAPSLPVGLVPPARWSYGDGVWLVYGLDGGGNPILRAGDSISTATEPVEWEVAGPLDYIDAWYSGDGEWRGYCYPADEDYWPDYWLSTSYSEDGIWGIELT